MLVNLSDILSDNPRTIDVMIPMEDFTFMGIYGTFPMSFVEPVHVCVEQVKNREFLVKAEAKIRYKIPCDRCLTDVEQELSPEVVRYINLNLQDGEEASGFDEANFIRGHHLDLDKLFYGEILANWPNKTLCTDDCQGICSICGQNLNISRCNCEDTDLDPRMSVIRDIFQQLGD